MDKDNETAVTAISEPHEDKSAAAEAGSGCLVVLYGKNLGKRYHLGTGALIAGRSDSSDIVIDQESVSRHHIRLATQEGHTKVSDLDSTNGTFINNERVHERELHDGDQVRIGETIFKYLSGSNIEAKYHEEIYRLTTTDGLTLAFNKRYLLETLTREIHRAVRYSKLIALAMFDIDHFKRVNDEHGHLAGDYVLRDLAAIVLQNIRREDVCARYGGEEFALILPEIDDHAALLVCEKLRRSIQEATFDCNGKKIKVTISIGLRMFSGKEANAEITSEELIQQADERLYEAKQSGRNRIVYR